MNPVALDTHALIWWTLDPDMLSSRARKRCAEISTTGAIISSISIWEIGIKIARNALDIGLDIETYTERLSRMQSLSIIAVDERIWMKNVSLDWAHRDPADRTIVATAMIHGCDLLTKDTTIRAFYRRSVW